MEVEVEMAFRTLQAGLNTGKIVIRVASRSSHALCGAHIVTGGTGGLGLLTARWIAQNGASRLVLASRSGKRSSASAGEWQLLTASDAEAIVQRCDSADDGHVKRLVASTLDSLVGVWHAAGVLADGVLPSQTTDGMRYVYSPKVYGSWALQLSSASMP